MCYLFQYCPRNGKLGFGICPKSSKITEKIEARELYLKGQSYHERAGVLLKELEVGFCA